MQSLVGGAMLTGIDLAFLLSSRRRTVVKLSMLVRWRRATGEVERIVRTVRRGVEQYAWVQTTTGLLIAVVSWGVMAMMGVENAAALALVVFLTSLIPIVGPALGVLAPALFALVHFSSPLQPLVLAAGLQGVNLLINNVWLPRLQSRRLDLDPTAMLLSLALWTFLWGLPGALLATPLTVLVMSVRAQAPSLRRLAVLLSRDGRRTHHGKETAS